ncbi:hypothetical protein GCM10022403_005280 [Streptomyces coacervatus]|uniref:HNH nuclease domain-containing protein n=1 Tax=Streptomyces coacervatus TaxID=647381 RepID=A0ABP7GQ77_9ACTN
MIGTVPVGLEAAHVRWWACDGPDDVDNGLCLCSLHHKLFDKGVLGIGDGHRILVSQHFVGRSRVAREHVTAPDIVRRWVCPAQPPPTIQLKSSSIG